MGIGAWLRKLRGREDERVIERAEERQVETPDERRVASGDLSGLEADERAARTMHEPNIDDAERLGDDR